MNLAILKKIGWRYISKPRCRWERQRATRIMRRYLKHETDKTVRELEREGTQEPAV